MQQQSSSYDHSYLHALVTLKFRNAYQCQLTQALRKLIIKQFQCYYLVVPIICVYVVVVMCLFLDRYKMATSSGTSGSFQLPGKLVSFSHVRFVCIPETYTAGADVQCSFVIGEELEVNSRDWVGLYKVGWRSSSDYLYYEWSPLPSNYVRGTEVANRILFPGIIVQFFQHLLHLITMWSSLNCKFRNTAVVRENASFPLQ